MLPFKESQLDTRYYIADVVCITYFNVLKNEQTVDLTFRGVNWGFKGIEVAEILSASHNSAWPLI